MIDKTNFCFTSNKGYQQQNAQTFCCVCYPCKIFFDLFNKIKKTLHHLFSSGTSIAPIGGVVNIGNSCYISQVLQQLAAEADFFSLQFADQSDSLTQALTDCIQAIQNGQQVDVSMMHTLLDALIEKGWEEKKGAVGDPLTLLTFIATFLKVNHFSYENFIGNASQDPVVYVTDVRALEIEKLYQPKGLKVLWVINNPDPKKIPDEIIRTETHHMELRAIHMTQTSFFGQKHGYGLRKHGKDWYNCNDTKITQVALKKMPKADVRRLVYLSTPLNMGVGY